MRSNLFHPAKDLPQLFEMVQSVALYPDSKTFADAICLKDPELILSDFHKLKQREDFDLRDFINQNFEIPKINTDILETRENDIIAHIHSLWRQLSRKDVPDDRKSSKISLPYPYVVPGGRFNEIYYWDSYFTMLGLVESGEIQLAIDMFNNFVWLIDQFGYISNGNRSYYLGRSQPPFFALMTELMMSQNLIHADQKLLEVLLTEYKFWKDKMTDVSVSSKALLRAARYCDDTIEPREESYREDVEIKEKAGDPIVYQHLRSACESGWDFSSRWFKDKKSLETIITADIIPIDLNCLIWHLETTISSLASGLGQQALAETYGQYASGRRQYIQNYFFNPDFSWFDDLNIDGKFMYNKTLAGTFPMFFGLASDEQAGYCAAYIQQKFLLDGGLATTTEHSGQQWDYPNGWAPLQYITVHGLLRYGYDELATEIMNRWCTTVEREFNASGKIMEKYNVVDTNMKGGGGEYPNQDGFGWTNAVYLVFKNQMKLKKT